MIKTDRQRKKVRGKKEGEQTGENRWKLTEKYKEIDRNK